MRPPLGASLACHSPLCDPGWVPRLLRASLSPRNVFFHHAKQVMGTAQKGLVNCEGLSPCAVPGSGLEVGGVVGTGTWSLICFSSSFPLSGQGPGGLSSFLPASGHCHCPWRAMAGTGRGMVWEC